MLKIDADMCITYGGTNWAAQIKEILETHGLGEIWLLQDPNVVPLSMIKQRILDIYQQSWYSQINNSSRLSSYCKFKHSFEQEKYLNVITDKKYRIALCKFRVSAHNLSIERGRYDNISRENRICIYCNLQAIESEFHFLLVCPFFRDLRRKFFSPYYCHWPSLSKFETLMTSESKNTISKLAKYIYSAEKLRNTAK